VKVEDQVLLSSPTIDEIADEAAAIVLAKMKAEAGPGEAFTIDEIAEKAASIALNMIAEKERKGFNFRKVAGIPAEPLVTHGSANVFDDLGFSPEEADDLKERSDLMSSLRDRVRVLCWSPDSAAAALRCPTAVMIDLYAGNIDAFTLPALRDYKAALDRYEDWLKTPPIDHFPEAQGWICVDDRLPEENIVVEAAFSEDGFGRFKASLNHYGQWRLKNGAIKYPKAWRPLSSAADSDDRDDRDDRPAPSPPAIEEEAPKAPASLNKAIDRMWLDRLIPEGHIYREVDGFFVFAPQKGFGAIAPWALRMIADHIDALNEPWEKELAISLGAEGSEARAFQDLSSDFPEPFSTPEELAISSEEAIAQRIMAQVPGRDSEGNTCMVDPPEWVQWQRRVGIYGSLTRESQSRLQKMQEAIDALTESPPSEEEIASDGSGPSPGRGQTYSKDCAPDPIAGPTYDQEEVKILASMSPEEVQATIEEAKQSLLEKARRIL
jgi:hypothetical protein